MPGKPRKRSEPPRPPASPKPARPPRSSSPAHAVEPVLKHVYVRDRAAWRAWLEVNHARSPGIWLIFDKIGAGKGRLPYADAVEEALCFGWIDSVVRTIDEGRYEQLFTPRKPKSTWSRTNKERVARLSAAGLMRPAGVAAIEAARRNGSWSSLDAVESLQVPPELAAALARTPDARRNFDAFPPSARKAYLHWVLSAKRPETLAKRIAEVARLAAANRKTPTKEG